MRNLYLVYIGVLEVWEPYRQSGGGYKEGRGINIATRAM